jgi:hypothetical protein
MKFKLDKLNLNLLVIAPVGYRHEEDDTQHYKKLENQTRFYYTIIINTNYKQK